MSKKNKTLQLNTLNKDASNMIITNIINRAGYINLATQIITTRVLNRFKWNNIPFSLDSNEIEKLLYENRSLVAVNYNNLIELFRYSVKYFDIYGRPSVINLQPILRNDEVAVNFDEIDYNVIYNNYNILENPAVILNDFNFGTQTMQEILTPILKNIVDIFAHQQINRIIGTKKAIYKTTADRRLMSERELNDFFSTDAFYTLVNENNALSKIELLNPSTDYKPLDYWHDISNNINMLSDILGIENSGFFNKKERVINAEQAGGTEQSNINLQEYLTNRNVFCEKLNKVFGTNLTVNINNEINDYDSDGGDFDDI